jgi:hypothetical protein
MHYVWYVHKAPRVCSNTYYQLLGVILDTSSTSYRADTVVYIIIYYNILLLLYRYSISISLQLTDKHD